MSDGAANPYLATAAVLQAARLGLTQDSTLPPAEEQDCLESQSTDRHTPDNLSLALDALEADAALVEALGQNVVDHFVAIKRFEWEKFTAAVTDWELNFYQPFL
jgi:glutamine synthetase